MQRVRADLRARSTFCSHVKIRSRCGSLFRLQTSAHSLAICGRESDEKGQGADNVLFEFGVAGRDGHSLSVSSRSCRTSTTIGKAIVEAKYRGEEGSDSQYELPHKSGMAYEKSQEVRLFPSSTTIPTLNISQLSSAFAIQNILLQVVLAV